VELDVLMDSRRLLAAIDDLNELKIVSFCLWAFAQRDGEAGLRWLRYEEIIAAEQHGLERQPASAALARALRHGVLLVAQGHTASGVEPAYTLCTPQAQATVGAAGFVLTLDEHGAEILPPRPSVFKLYEENIGPLTGLIGQDLGDLTRDYGENWLREAIEVAVEREKRSLRYVKGVLRGWRKEGKRDAAAQQKPATTQRSATGDFADFFKR
jgi:DnaD/phage-associated family protein